VRPRFVIVLAAAAVAAAIVAAVRWPDVLSDASYARRILGIDLIGMPAKSLALAEPIFFLATAIGLWLLRPWARVAAMGYLAYVIVAFLFFGIGPTDGRRATAVMLWQISVVPFATFCFMFLYNGTRYFRRSGSATSNDVRSIEGREAIR
jgi:hypothetical protein